MFSKKATVCVAGSGDSCFGSRISWRNKHLHHIERFRDWRLDCAAQQVMLH